MDAITQQRIMTLHPVWRLDVKKGFEMVNNIGLEARITLAFRSLAEQEAYYWQDKLSVAEVNKLRFAAHLPLFPDNGQKLLWASNARGGESYHNYGLAFDFCIKHKDGSVSFDFNEDSNDDKKADFLQVIEIFQSLGCVSGMSFKDNDHIEKSFGHSFTDLAAMVNSGKVDSNGFVII